MTIFGITENELKKYTYLMGEGGKEHSSHLLRDRLFWYAYVLAIGAIRWSILELS